MPKSPIDNQKIKHNTIVNYGEKYKISTLVETGTYLGATVDALKDNFEKIYTIELNKRLYKRAKKKFKKYKYIKVFFGDSEKVLPRILKKINGTYLFWLDAHYSKGITSKGTKVTPVWEEINAILADKIKKHVILIDDADAFTGKEGYPALKDVKKLVLERRPQMKFRILHNIIRITPY